MENVDREIDCIPVKLARLQQLDPGLAAFGASSHEYSLRPPLPESEVACFERRFGVSLPADYRRFVTRLGAGGAGPYYGVFLLDGSDPEDITNFDQLDKPFQWSDAFNPIEWDNPCAHEDIECDEDDDPPFPVLRAPSALYICHYGCAIRFFLVVNGPSFGEVWIDRQADRAGFAPVCSEDGRRLSLLEWYEQWLDQGLSHR